MEEPSADAGLRQVFRALRHRNFQLFLAGQTVSLVGTWMQSVAQSWLVYRLTHSELLLGTTWFCMQLPVFALGPLGGLASDRWSRQRVVLWTQSLLMLQAFVLAGLTLVGRVGVGHVLGLALVLGAINAFDMPARQALIGELAGKDDLLSAISLNSTMFNVARVIGPGIAGALVAAVGEGVCFLLNAISFLAVIGCLLAMRLEARGRAAPAESPWSHLMDGFRFVYGHVPVRTLLAMVAAITICGMPVLVLMPVFADAEFHRGAQGLGMLSGAMGLGAVVGVLRLAGRARVAGLGRVIFWSAGTLGVAFIVFAVSQWFYLSLMLMFAIGFSVFRQLASTNTLIQCLIPDEYRGLTMSLYAMAVVGLGPFGSIAAGAVAHGIGSRGTVLAAGVMSVAAALLFRLHLDKFPEEGT